MEFSRPEYWEWVAFPFSRGFSQSRNQTGVSCIAGGFFTNRAIREARGTLKALEKKFFCFFLYMCKLKLIAGNIPEKRKAEVARIRRETFPRLG